MPTHAQLWHSELVGLQTQMRDLVDLATGGDVIQALTVIDELCDVGEFARSRAVASARQQGVTWEEIGTALGGLSRQAVWERYRSVVNPKKQRVSPSIQQANGSAGK